MAKEKSAKTEKSAQTLVNYVITIRTTQTKRRKKKSVASNSGSSAVGEGTDREIEEKEKGVIDTLHHINNMAAIGYAKQMANSFITHRINKVELRTGNALLQQKISYTYDTARLVSSSVSSIIFGAATGNPLAAAAGVMSLVNRGIELAQAAEKLNLERQVENIGRNMANIRAGTYGSRLGK